MVKNESREEIIRRYMESVYSGIKLSREVKPTYKRFTIQIEDSKFTAVLLEERAQKTCQAFWNHLREPAKGWLINIMWCGEAVSNYGKGFGFSFDLEKEVSNVYENATSLTSPGDIIYIPNVGEIIIVYGSAMLSTPYGQIKGNLFGRITEKLEDLRRICILMRLEGIKKVTMRRESG